MKRAAIAKYDSPRQLRIVGYDSADPRLVRERLINALNLLFLLGVCVLIWVLVILAAVEAIG